MEHPKVSHQPLCSRGPCCAPSRHRTAPLHLVQSPPHSWHCLSTQPHLNGLPKNVSYLPCFPKLEPMKKLAPASYLPANFFLSQSRKVSPALQSLQHRTTLVALGWKGPETRQNLEQGQPLYLGERWGLRGCHPE